MHRYFVLALTLASLTAAATARQGTSTSPPAARNASPPSPRNASPQAAVNASPTAPGNASPQAPGNVSPQAPGNASPQAPGNATPAAPLDPAAAIFSSGAGLMLVTVKGDKTGDYEEVIRALQAALAQATDDTHRAIAKGWRVFKAEQPVPPDPKANVVYIHLLDPAVATIDYRPSMILDEMLAGASAEMLGKYRDAIVAAPAKLGMDRFADMTEPPPPKNTSADAPIPPKKP